MTAYHSIVICALWIVQQRFSSSLPRAHPSSKCVSLHCGVGAGGNTTPLEPRSLVHTLDGPSLVAGVRHCLASAGIAVLTCHTPAVLTVVHPRHGAIQAVNHIAAMHGMPDSRGSAADGDTGVCLGLAIDDDLRVCHVYENSPGAIVRVPIGACVAAVDGIGTRANKEQVRCRCGSVHVLLGYSRPCLPSQRWILTIFMYVVAHVSHVTPAHVFASWVYTLDRRFCCSIMLAPLHIHSS